MTWHPDPEHDGAPFWEPDVPGAWHWNPAHGGSLAWAVPLPVTPPSPPPPEVREARVYRTGLADAGRCWCPAAHLPPFCSRPEPPGLAARFLPPRWLAVAAMILALLTAEAWMAVLLTAAIRLVTS